jgi:ATP-binding cassette subfamily C (CFTR/MRP) protein 1
MASDASRNMERAVELIPPIYILPIQFIVVFAILVDLLNWAMLTVVIGVIVVMPINIYIFIQINKLQQAAAVFTDQRVKLINELLSGIRVVKFYGWEIPFKGRIEEAREKELGVIKSHAYWMSMGLTTMFTQIPSLLQLGALLTYALTGGDISPQIVFVALPYFQQLQQPLTQIPMAISTLTQRRVGLERITTFMKLEELPEKEPVEVPTSPIPSSPTNDKAPSVTISNGEFTWTKDLRDAALVCGKDLAARSTFMSDYRKKMALLREAEKAKEKKSRRPPAKGATVVDAASPPPPKIDVEIGDAVSVLSGLNFEIKRGELIGVVGPVGCGKSSFLYSILGELLKIEGEVKVRGSVALAEQQVTLWIRISLWRAQTRSYISYFSTFSLHRLGS